MTSPYLTTREAADHLRYKTTAGFMRAVHGRRIPHIIRGRERLFLPADLDSAWDRSASAIDRRRRPLVAVAR